MRGVGNAPHTIALLAGGRRKCPRHRPKTRFLVISPRPRYEAAAPPATQVGFTRLARQKRRSRQARDSVRGRRRQPQRMTVMATVREMNATARVLSKASARSERRAGRVPGIIYGDNKPPLTISVDHKDLRQRIYAGRFLTTVYELNIDGTKHRVIPRDFQLDPVKDLPIHVDFLRLGVGAQIRVRIPVHVLNADQSPGVKRGGAVNLVTHTIEVQCSADRFPNRSMSMSARSRST